jgi:hypothetical protein
MALGDAYITVDELKDYAQIRDAIDDAALEQVTRAASASVENFCHRQFNDAGVATARVYDVTDPWYLRVDDFSTLTGLVVKTDTGNNGGYATTVTTSVVAHPLNGVRDGVPGWPFYELVMSQLKFPWPTWIVNPAGPLVQVTAQWGWAAVPPEVKQATLIKAARVFGRRYSTNGVIGAGDFVFRVSRESDPDVVDLLTPLKNPTVAIA